METVQISDLRWHSATKIFFRFISAFFLLYIFPFPLNFLPFADSLNNFYNQFWDKLVLWVGKDILQIPYNFPLTFNGSGDRTYDYIQFLTIFAAAMIFCLSWTLLDWRRRHYRTLFYWLTVTIRYYLAFVMFGYGFAKIFKTQFPFLRLEKLLTAYGDSSPMGLAWNFMGYSWGYNIFTGGAEVLGGLLLLFRRTTVLGALILVGVMSNVAMMNYCYDIPVKLYSSVLLLMAVFLLAKDAKRIAGFFIFNQPAPPADLAPPYNDKKIDRARLALKILFCAYVIFTTISQVVEIRQTARGDNRPQPLLYGIYDVHTFIQNGDTLPPLVTDSTRWRKLLVDLGGRVSIKYMNDKLERIGFRPDSVAQTITLFALADTTQKFSLHYAQSGKEELHFQGRWREDSVHIQMKKFDLNKFLLINRGYNWINEFPFNR